MSRPWVGLCWMSRNPIARDDTRSHEYRGFIGTGYTGRKFRRDFGGRSWEEDVGGIEGVKGGMMALSGLYSVSIGAG